MADDIDAERNEDGEERRDEGREKEDDREEEEELEIDESDGCEEEKRKWCLGDKENNE